MSASADPHFAIIDADVGYFRRHPRRRHRVRPRSQADVEALAQGARTHKSRLFGNRWLPRATCADGANGPIDIDGGFKNCLDSFVADVSLYRCLNGFWAWLPYHIRPQLRFSGGLSPPSPPAEKATARQDQTWQASTGDGAGGGD